MTSAPTWVRPLAGHLIKHQSAVIFVKYLVAQALAHTLLDHHFPGNLGGFTQVRASARSNAVIAVNNLLSDPAAHRPRQDILELIDVGVALILWR